MYRQDINIKLNNKDMEHLRHIYHFTDSDERMLYSLYDAVLPVVDAHAYVRFMDKTDKWNESDIMKQSEYGICLVTLGQTFDRMQDIYTDRKCLSEMYMLDCIGLELLMKSYEEIVRYVQQKSGLWVEKLIFPGERGFSLSYIGDICKSLSVKDITYNKQGMLNPRKSAAFLMPLTKNKVDRNVCNICTGCGNINCVLRRQENEKTINKASVRNPDNIYSYGYSQIFGNKNIIGENR